MLCLTGAAHRIRHGTALLLLGDPYGLLTLTAYNLTTVPSRSSHQRIPIGSLTPRVNWYHWRAALVTGSARNCVLAPFAFSMWRHGYYSHLGLVNTVRSGVPGRYGLLTGQTLVVVVAISPRKIDAADTIHSGGIFESLVVMESS